MPGHEKERIREEFVAGQVHELVFRVYVDVCVLLDEFQQVRFLGRAVIPVSAAIIFQACYLELTPLFLLRNTCPV